MTDMHPSVAASYRQICIDDRPHVYHVRAFDLEGLKSAIKSALATPIGSYIPPHMRFGQVCEYTAAVLNGDWRGKAELILQERKAGNGKVSLSAETSARVS